MSKKKSNGCFGNPNKNTVNPTGKTHQFQSDTDVIRAVFEGRLKAAEWVRDSWTTTSGKTLECVRIHSGESDPKILEQMLDQIVEKWFGRKIYRTSQRYGESVDGKSRVMASTVGNTVFLIGTLDLDEKLTPQVLMTLLSEMDAAVLPRPRKEAA